MKISDDKARTAIVTLVVHIYSRMSKFLIY